MKPAGFSSSNARTRLAPALAILLAACPFVVTPHGACATAPPAGIFLPRGRDAFFIENNLVYRRFLALSRDGTYRQINRDPATATEADSGTWEQAADGTIRLHSARHALRFRALLGGPLLVTLDSQEKRDALPQLAAAIRRLLAGTEDAVFDAHAIAECHTPGVSVAIDPGAETFMRADLQSLVRQIDDTTAAERTGVYMFQPLKVTGVPLLLILQDAVFQTDDLARVRRDYHVKSGEPPPFFFAQVEARTFAREAGTWEAFHFVGGTD